MKKQTLITLTLMLVVASAVGQSTTIAIKDVRQSKQPSPEPGKHKHHEALVFRSLTSKGEEAYVLVYYQKEKDSMNYHKAIYSSAEDMNIATYSWNKDTIAVRLYNAITKKEIKFRAFGNGKSSSMMTDE